MKVAINILAAIGGANVIVFVVHVVRDYIARARLRKFWDQQKEQARRGH